ncbi:hypothetical protein LIER_00891 [Lithospermum erythrorhizon]|uniref:Uncharacterized protein n=1 Tax=Lithospermum erythrorhizon TaxID=34254 RepID=A0AAV3NMM5_LITER
MCLEFTCSNKACPKDCYPLPNIDRLVDSSVGYKELKVYLQSPQLLARPVVGDVLQLYLVVSESALGSVLISEEEKERNQEVDRLSQLATTEYGTLLDSTTVESVAEKAFRMKEVMDNAPEGD